MLSSKPAPQHNAHKLRGAFYLPCRIFTCPAEFLPALPHFPVKENIPYQQTLHHLKKQK